MKNKVDKGTLVRTVVLLFALVNQFLVMSGRDILPFSEAGVSEFVSVTFTGIASLITWWKNNSFTNEAIDADKYLDELRSKNND